MSESAVSFGAPRVRTSSSGCTVAFLWAFVAMWYGFIGAIALVIYFQGGPRQWGPIAVIGFFALAGLLVVSLAAMATVNAARFRGTDLALESNPGVLGGRITGALRVPQRVLRFEPLQFRVSLWRRYRKKSDDLLWETIEPVGRPMAGASDMTTLPFSIRLPYDGEETTSPGGLPDFYWQLELRSAKGSVAFDVPVARTSQSSAEQTKAVLRPSVSRAPAAATAKIDRKLNSVDVAFPLPTWVWKWYTFVVIATVAAVAVANVILQRMSADGMPESVRAMTYLAIGIVALFLGAFPLLSLALSVRRVRADRAGVEIGYALPARGPSRLNHDALKDVVTEYSNSSRKYSVDFVRADGKPVIGTVILVETKEEAEWIASELRRAIFGQT